MIRVLLVDDQELVRSGFRIILESEPDIEVVGEASTGAEGVELAAALAPDVVCMDVEMPVLNGIEASRLILSAPGESGTTAGGGNRTPAILVLTTFGHEAYLFEALAAGVSGFLLKTSRAEQLIDAVRSLAAGNALLGPDVTRAVIARIAADRAGAAAPAAATAPAPTHTAPPAASATIGAGPAASSFSDSGPTALGTADSPRVSERSAERASAHSAEQAADPLAERGVTEREREVLEQLSAGCSNAEIAAALFLGEATVKTHVSNLLQKLGVRDRIQAVVWAHTHSVTGA